MTDALQLAAIAYSADQGHAVDHLLATLAEDLIASGHRLAGAIQINHQRSGRRRCDMTLRDLCTGRLIRISEDRGPSACGCHLDHHALLEAAGLASIGLAQGADMLVVNKFSKREAEGSGFRGVIEEAVGQGVPVLTAVSTERLSVWKDFCGGLSPILAADPLAVRAWCTAAIAGTRGRTDAIHAQEPDTGRRCSR
jgi:hypothetical protein